jgi:hypothetical protein
LGVTLHEIVGPFPYPAVFPGGSAAVLPHARDVTLPVAGAARDIALKKTGTIALQSTEKKLRRHAAQWNLKLHI